MNGIFPRVEDIEAELESLRAEREALDAAIAERQLFVELGRRLAGQRRGGGTDTPARTEFKVSPQQATETLPERERGGRAHHDDGSEVLTPRSSARLRGRALVSEAVAILRSHDRPMHAAELVPLLAERGHVLPGHDPVAALNTRLWKRARTGRFVVRRGDAVYAAGEGTPDETE